MEPGRSCCIIPCLNRAGLVEVVLQRGDLGVHVGEDGGDGLSFGEGREGELDFRQMVAAGCRSGASVRGLVISRLPPGVRLVPHSCPESRVWPETRNPW